MNRRISFLLAGIGLSLAITACGAKKKEAQEEFAKVEADCKAGDKKSALAKALSLRDKNEHFKRAFDNATTSVPDKNNVNICGALVRGEISLAIDNL